MFKLLRYFSLTSALAIIAATVVLVVLHRQSAVSELIASAETHNASLARSFANTIWPDFVDYITTVDEDGDSLRQRPETSQLHEAMRNLTDGLPVLKIKIYNLQGLTVYSSQASQMGEDKSGNAGFLMAREEATSASKLSFRDSFSAFSGAVENRDLVESYVPVRREDGAVEGVLEIYTDVTPLMARLDRNTTSYTALFLLICVVLYGVLFVIVRRADGILKKQYHELEQKEKNIQAKNTSLEHEVTERQRAELALRDMNEDLEVRVVERTAKLHEAQEDLLRKQRLASLGQLIGTVGHDLRNPLGVIRNSLAVIRERGKQVGLDLERQLERSERSLSRCDGIIHDLLDNTRIQDIALKPTAIDAWLLEVLDEQTPPDGIGLDCDLTASGVEVPLDVERFRRVVINIFDNACQAMAENPDGGKGHLTVATRVEGGRLAISFQDTGPGIDPELMAKIFEPLFTTKQQGVGLGLPMVKQIVELHGGVIDITSEKGQGTCVTLRMPTRDAAEAAA